MNTKLFCGAAALLAGCSSPPPPPRAMTSPMPSTRWPDNPVTVGKPPSWCPRAPFRPGDSSGKTEKGGYTDVKQSMMGNDMEIILKGDKVAINTPDNGWQAPDTGADQQGPGRFMAMMARASRHPWCRPPPSPPARRS